MKDKEKKNTVSSKEMTTTDQIENISNHKNSTNTYNINLSNKSLDLNINLLILIIKNGLINNKLIMITLVWKLKMENHCS